MINTKNLKTEEKIIQAAKKVFLKQGMAGARMQQIADEAGINKSLLHYYFRSKDKLFQMVLRNAKNDFLPRIDLIFSGKSHFFDKIRYFVDEYLTIVEKNPYLPLFILHESHCNYENNIGMTDDLPNQLIPFVESVDKAILEKSIRTIKPNHLFVNIISLCSFPFISKPLVMNNFLHNNEKQFDNFIQERKEQVADFIIRSIKIS